VGVVILPWVRFWPGALILVITSCFTKKQQKTTPCALLPCGLYCTSKGFFKNKRFLAQEKVAVSFLF
jgi:hypothetical protein